MNNRSTISRLNAVLEEWANGFDVSRFLDNLLATQENEPFSSLGLHIAAAGDIPNDKTFKLISILEQCARSSEYQQNREIREKFVKLLCGQKTHGRDATFGDYVSCKRGALSESIRNDYFSILQAVIKSGSLTQQQYITLLARHPANNESTEDRLATLPKLLLDAKDLHNLNLYFGMLNDLVRSETLNSDSVRTIFQAFVDIKIGNLLTAAYKYQEDKTKIKSDIPAAISFFSLLETVYTKYGLNHETVFDKDRLDYAVQHFPKQEIYQSLVKNDLSEMTFGELQAQLTLLEKMRNPNHPLGYLVRIQRGINACDEMAGTLGDARHAYNQTRKEIFFKELTSMSLKARLEKCKKALHDRNSDEYKMLLEPTSYIEDRRPPDYPKVHVRLREEIKKVEILIEVHGENFILPSAPPQTLDLGHECHSLAARSMLALIGCAKALHLPRANEQFKSFVSKDVQSDGENICAIFESEAATEIAICDHPDIIKQMLVTLESVAATSPEFALRVSTILGMPRISNTGSNLLHLIINHKFSQHQKNNLNYLRPVLHLLELLSSESCLHHVGVISLLGITNKKNTNPGMLIPGQYDNESCIAYIKLLQILCSSKDNARDMLTMLQTEYTKSVTTGYMIGKYGDYEALLEYIVLLDKIMVEHGVAFECHTVMTNELTTLGYTAKENLLKLVEKLCDDSNATQTNLELCTRLSLGALDENHPMGHIMYMARDITTPKIDTGTRKKFAELLHKAQQKLDEIVKIKTVATDETAHQLPESPPPSYAESQRLYAPVFFAKQAVIPSANSAADLDKLENSAYLKLAETDTITTSVETHIQATAPIIEEVKSVSPEPISISSESVLDQLFGSVQHHAEVLTPTAIHAESGSNCAVGNLLDLESLESEANTSSPILDSLLGIDFTIPVQTQPQAEIIEEQPEPTEQDSSDDILARLEALEPPPQHAPNTVLFQQRKEVDKPAPKNEEKRKVLSYAN